MRTLPCVLVFWLVLGASGLAPSDQVGFVDLINALYGLPFDWQTSDVANACSWWGVSCTTFAGLQRVTQIRLQRDNQTDGLVVTPGYGRMVGGELPDTFLNFPQLAQFIVNTPSELNGTIPPSLISYHPSVYYLGITGAHLFGHLPTQFSPSLSLLFVRLTPILGENLLSGPLPWNLTKISGEIDLSSNMFGCPVDLDVLNAINSRCRLNKNNMQLQHGKWCGNVPVSGTKCLVTPQFQALPEVGSPSSDAILHVNSSIVVLRITPDGKHIVAYVRDKNTLALLDDRYFVFDMMAYSTSDPPKVVGVFSGFTSDIRLVGNQYQVDGSFTNGQTITILFDVVNEGKAIKIGWHLSGNGTMQVAPTVYFSIFLKAPMQNNSPGFNCTPVVVDFNSVGDLMDIVGVEYMSCTGTDANLVLKLDLYDLDGGGQEFFYEYRYASDMFDISFLWAVDAIVDGQKIAFMTRGLAFYVAGGVDPRKAFLSSHFGPPLQNVDIDKQWVAAYIPMKYPDFHTNLLYDPLIRSNVLFSLGSPDESIAPLVGGVVGGILGAVVVGLGIAILASPKFRAKVLPFTIRRYEDASTTLGSESPPVAREAAWQPASGANSKLRNTHSL